MYHDVIVVHRDNFYPGKDGTLAKSKEGSKEQYISWIALVVVVFLPYTYILIGPQSILRLDLRTGV